MHPCDLATRAQASWGESDCWLRLGGARSGCVCSCLTFMAIIAIKEMAHA